MTIEKKNEAAAQLGSLGGKARAQSLSDDQRREIARLGGHAKWQKNRDRPGVHEVVKQMLDKIKQTGKPHRLFSVHGIAKFCESGSSFDTLWSMDASTVVGSYGSGASLTEVLNDFLAT